MRVLFLSAMAFLVALTAPALAGNKSSSTAVAVSQNQNINNNRVSSSNSNSISNSIRNRQQAPGFGVGGGYCSDAFSASFPGGGFGFSFMNRVCKQEKLLGMADQYFGRPAARQVGCEQVAEFRSLPTCVQGRINKARAVQLRDRRNARR